MKTPMIVSAARKSAPRPRSLRGKSLRSSLGLIISPPVTLPPE